METKKLKKLELKKETIASLSNQEQRFIYGGETKIPNGCDTCTDRASCSTGPAESESCETCIASPCPSDATCATCIGMTCIGASACIPNVCTNTFAAICEELSCGNKCVTVARASCTPICG